MQTTTQIRWYREPWPWLLMAGPAGVVVAGIATIWLAFAHEDGLVADDYYKQGLAINRVIARDAQARASHVAAVVEFRGGGAGVALRGAHPRALTLSLVHPTRAGEDRGARLEPVGEGRYEGALEVPSQGRWHIVLSDAEGNWRLIGEWSPLDGPGAVLAALPESGRP
jgi:hypothetical protein